MWTQQNQILDSPTKMKLLLEFAKVFPEEVPLKVEEYLKGGGKNVILNVATFLLGLNKKKSKYEKSHEALGMFFRKENLWFAKQVYNQITKLEKNTGREVQIFSTYSSLTLFETFFRMPDEIITQSEEEFEQNIFKAYLVINSEFTNKQSLALKSTSFLEDRLKFPMSIFCSFFGISDIESYNINQVWIAQIVKAIMLFQCLEKQQETLKLLEGYLEGFDCFNWREYLKKLIPLTEPAIRCENEGSTNIRIQKNDDFEKNSDFVEKLILGEKENLTDFDFISIRAKPLYKIKEGVYQIIFNLFVVEKIFKGAYFLFREVNDNLPKEDRITNLKSYIGEEFSEKILLYNILEKVYPNKCKKHSGKELADNGIDGAPDYYIRHGKNILVFESKDFLIPAAIKDSFDFTQFESELKRKLYFEEKNGKKKYKAVLQLIRNVERILTNQFEADKDYKYRQVKIYPIIITHDHLYDANGFNFLINEWFQSELEVLRKRGLFIYRVRPLVVINIDALIYHQHAFSNHVKFHDTLELYLNYVHIDLNLKFPNAIEAVNYHTNKLIAFSTFINNYMAGNQLIKTPEIIKQLGLELFRNDFISTS